jgi:hypothetical protein
MPTAQFLPAMKLGYTHAQGLMEGFAQESKEYL